MHRIARNTASFIALAAGLSSATPLWAHICRDKILLEDGSLNRGLIEQWFGPLGSVSHIYRVGSPFFKFDSFADENGFVELLSGNGIELPSGMGLIGRGFTADMDAINLFYQCPETDDAKVLCTYEPSRLSEVDEKFARDHRIGEYVNIQYPEESPVPLFRLPIGGKSDHTCTYAIEYNKLGEPLNLRAFEERPARTIIDEAIQGFTGDPTPQQYARGVYIYNFQLMMGIDHEFVR